MTVKNRTRGVILCEGVLVAKTFNDKANGLSGKDAPAAIFFKTRWGIHTFGVKFPIDCVITDNNFEIKGLEENLKPNRFFFWQPKYKNVLELPAGTISKTGTRVGDILEMS
ncbi:MAG: DUF192 domain-containing protein [Minisyncoccia bacterium]|jgi:uncharacterized membrane protein (UPF0127 family)